MSSNTITSSLADNLTVAQLNNIANRPSEIVSGERRSKVVALARLQILTLLRDPKNRKRLRSTPKKKKARKAPLSVTHLVKRLVYGGEGIRGKNGCFLRVAIERDSFAVSKVNSKNWTPSGERVLKKLYPTGKGTIGRRLTSGDRLMKMAQDAYERELGRRTKMERNFMGKFGVSFGTFDTTTDVEEEDGDGGIFLA